MNLSIVAFKRGENESRINSKALVPNGHNFFCFVSRIVSNGTGPFK